MVLKNKRCEVDEKGLEAGDFVFSALKHGTSTDRFFFLTSTFITIGRFKRNIERKVMQIKITGLRVLGVLTLPVVTLEIGCNKL